MPDMELMWKFDFQVDTFFKQEFLCHFEGVHFTYAE